MLCEQLSRRGRAFLEASSWVQASPDAVGFPRLHVGDERLSDSESFGDGRLGFASVNCREDRPIPRFHGIRSTLHGGDDGEGLVRPGGLDLHVGPAKCQERPAIVCVAGAEDEQRQGWPLRVSLDTAVSEPGLDVIQNGLEGVGDPDADAAFLRVDFDAPFAVKKAGEVTRERFIRKLFDIHEDIIRTMSLDGNRLMAVPVMRWIGRRLNDEANP
jgi:hypothetical protein